MEGVPIWISLIFFVKQKGGRDRPVLSCSHYGALDGRTGPICTWEALLYIPELEHLWTLTTHKHQTTSGRRQTSNPSCAHATSPNRELSRGLENCRYHRSWRQPVKSLLLTDRKKPRYLPFPTGWCWQVAPQVKNATELAQTETKQETQHYVP